MRTDEKTYNEIKRLFSEYEKEINNLYEEGVLQEKTLKTYLTHAHNFIRWIKYDFEPGTKNKRFYR